MTSTVDDMHRDADVQNTAPSAPPPEPDELGEALISHGLVPNDFILNLNHGLTVPHDMELPPPWNLPSRMFRFPIEVTDEQPRRIGLVHPLLGDHPYVQHVQNALGFEISPDGAPNEYGYSKRELALWWHAVDLITAGRWKNLLETERFTTPENVANAVAHGLHYSSHEGKKQNGYISTIEARKIMEHLDVPEPEDKPALLRQFMRPSSLKEDKKAERWPINAMCEDPLDGAWAHIIGIESGWFAHDRAGFLQWTAAGRDKFVEVVGQPEPTRHPDPVQDGRPDAIAEAREDVAPKPPNKPQQLTLF